MSGHYDFLVIWLPAGRQIAENFVTGTSFQTSNPNGNIHVFAWAGLRSDRDQP